jgi:hypothetical protein
MVFADGALRKCGFLRLATAPLVSHPAYFSDKIEGKSLIA